MNEKRENDQFRIGPRLLKEIFLTHIIYLILSSFFMHLSFFFFKFFWAPKSLQMVTAAMELKDACSLEEKL